MTGKLLRKELTLALHPAALCFLALSLMMLIPNYPYYVIFFYTGLGLFFTCLFARENRDVTYMLLLPLRKRDAVAARFMHALVLEGAQLLLAAAAAVLRNALMPQENQAGMDANFAFFGLALVQMGLFNALFFPHYYKNPEKVGVPFLVASLAEFVYIGLTEAAVFVVPPMRDVLDTPDPQHLGAKLLVLAGGLALFALMTGMAYKKSARNFEKIDC